MAKTTGSIPVGPTIALIVQWLVHRFGKAKIAVQFCLRAPFYQITLDMQEYFTI